jgi:hypothetical protein
LLDEEPRDVRRAVRSGEHGALVGFELEGVRWGLLPRTAFYDYLYLVALDANPMLGGAILDYRGFTDIEFNPTKSLNCQARSCALYVALRRSGRLNLVVSSPASFMAACSWLYAAGWQDGAQGALEFD